MRAAVGSTSPHITNSPRLGGVVTLCSELGPLLILQERVECSPVLEGPTQTGVDLILYIGDHCRVCILGHQCPVPIAGFVPTFC